MNDMQDFVANIRRKIGGVWPHVDAKDSLLYAFTELAEVADVLLHISNPEHKRARQMVDLKVRLREELGDVQLMLCTLANHFDIDLIEACADCCCDKLAKYGGTK